MTNRHTALCGTLLLASAALLHTTCHQAIMTAPPGSSLTLFANPPFIPANGGVSIITALVIEPAGTPVADGTVVQFFTTLGRIDEQGKTNDGVARVNLISDSRSGTAQVVAVSGGPAQGGPAPSPSPTDSPTPTPAPDGGGSGSGSVTVTIGTALPATVQVTADPSTIRVDLPRESVISAFVRDANGNGVANVPVIFSLSTPTGTERLEGEGQQRFTDNSGRAQDVLRTQYPLNADPKSVIVVATTANGKTGQVAVGINGDPGPPSSPPTSLRPSP
jgi:hypothetical protein